MALIVTLEFLTRSNGPIYSSTNCTMNTTILFWNYEVHGDDVQYPMIEFSDLKEVVWIVGLNIVTLEAKEKSWFEAKLAEGLMALPLPLKFSTYSRWPIYRYLQKLLRPYPSCITKGVVELWGLILSLWKQATKLVWSKVGTKGWLHCD